MNISRHLDGATLMSFTAGALSEPLAAAVSAHLSMCAECRDQVRALTLIGASLLRAAPVSSGRVPAPAKPQEQAGGCAQAPRGGHAYELPAPIARKYGLTLEDIEWTRLGSGVWQHRLALSAGAKGELYLMKLTPGCRLPVHGHAGAELTLVLTGAFSDETGEYRRGDVQEVDAGTEHQPVGDRDEGCICLIAAEGPYILRG
jgi:putative transcriptional regulator